MRKNEDMMVVITETVEAGEKERESMEGAESQILLETGTVSSTWVSSATKADLAMREENFREASSQKEVSSEGWSVFREEFRKGFNCSSTFFIRSSSFFDLQRVSTSNQAF